MFESLREIRPFRLNEIGLSILSLRTIYFLSLVFDISMFFFSVYICIVQLWRKKS